jgi:virginiamycin B lyase
MQVELGGGPYALAAGPDGAMWVTCVHGGEVARVSLDGEVRTFDAGPRPMIIAAGPDGALWFTRADAIVRMTTAGAQTAFAMEAPFGIVAGPDRALWFTATDRVGRLALDGRIDEWALPADSMPAMITTGPDGALWFTLNQASAIGRIDPRGDLTVRDTPTRGAGPVGIAATHDALWFTELIAARIGRIADEAPIQELALEDPGSRPHAVIAAQADGVWVSLWGSNQIAHVSDEGEVATIDLPAGSEPHGLAIGPEDALWVALESGAVIRIT